MKKIKLFSILINILEGLMIIGIIMLLIGSVVILTGNHSNWFVIDSAPDFKHNSRMVFVIEVLSGTFAMTAGCFLLTAIKKLIKNLLNSKYFVVENLNSIKKIFVSFSIITAMEFIFTIINFMINMTHHKVVIDLSSLIVHIIILGAIYLIYLVFKRGIELQEETNSII